MTMQFSPWLATMMVATPELPGVVAHPGGIHAGVLEVAAKLRTEGIIPEAPDHAHGIAEAGHCDGLLAPLPPGWI